MDTPANHGPQLDLDPLSELGLLVSDEDLLARIAAALWARVGHPLTAQDLSWSRTLTGDERTPWLLWEALCTTGVVSGEPPTLRAEPLSRLIFRLAHGDLSVPSVSAFDYDAGSGAADPTIVWTLPEAVRDKNFPNTYLESAIRLIRSAQSRILMISPYIEARGVGFLFAELVNSLSRGVRILLITHAAGDLASVNSRALEELRREATRVGGDLTVFSAGSNEGSADRARHPLLHAKLICVDEAKLLLGSANITSYGLTTNLEAGAILDTRAARRASDVVYRLLESRLVHKVFGT